MVCVPMLLPLPATCKPRCRASAAHDRRLPTLLASSPGIFKLCPSGAAPQACHKTGLGTLAQMMLPAGRRLLQNPLIGTVGYLAPVGCNKIFRWGVARRDPVGGAAGCQRWF